LLKRFSTTRIVSFDPFGQARLGSSLPVFQRRGPRLDAIAKGEIKLPSEQLELGMNLIEKMSSLDFEPERYADEYRKRALAMIEKKVEGQEIKTGPIGATAHRPGRRHLRSVKAEPGGSEAATSGGRRQEKTQSLEATSIHPSAALFSSVAQRDTDCQTHPFVPSSQS
jgi:hypothetical protein